MESLSTELRYIIRKLVRAPVFTAIAVLTLAVGIGANAAIFSVVNGVLIKPLPYENPDDLIGVWHTAPGLDFDYLNQSPALHFTYLDEGRVFENVGMWDNNSASVTGQGDPEELPVMLVTDQTLPMLGVQPLLGRTFSFEEDQPDAARTVVLSYGFWQSRFAGDPGVLGKTFLVEGLTREVIGVMPQGFRFLNRDPAFYMPFQFDRSEMSVGNFSYQGIARRKPGVTLEQINADIDRLVPIAIETFPGGITQQMLTEARFASRVRMLKDDVVGDVGSVLWVLLGTVGMILLIACANVANLFLVRAEGRQREVAVRTAMGANRAVVTRQFLLEALTLGAAGGAVGLAIAFAGLRMLVAMAPQGLPRLEEIGIDPGVLLFTGLISVGASVLFGLYPAFRYGNSDMVSSLKDGGRGGSPGKEKHRARNALVVGQMALAVVLLVGSGLMVRSFQALRAVSPGFENPEEVMTARISVPRAELAEAAQVALALEEIYRGMERIPGVTSVGMSSSVTMDGSDSNDAVNVEDQPVAEGSIPPIRRFKWISPDYFSTMGNPILAGRDITWTDVQQRAPVAVVTANFASEYWANPAEAIGKRISSDIISGGDAVWREIVGVVGDVHDDGVNEEATPTIFWPYAQESWQGGELRVSRSMVFALRTTRASAADVLPEMRRAIWSVNSNLPLAAVRSLDEILNRSMARTSFTLIMLGIAAGVALLLGSVGIYGVISYTVSQRTREIGVRMALGAERGDVSTLVLKQGMWLTAGGVGVGLLAATGLTRLMSTLLYGVRPIDPVTYSAVAVVLSIIALLATYVPARRAAGVDPVEALRWE